MCAALRKKIEGKAEQRALAYLKTKEGKMWVKMEKFPVREPRCFGACVWPTRAALCCALSNLGTLPSGHGPHHQRVRRPPWRCGGQTRGIEVAASVRLARSQSLLRRHHHWRESVAKGALGQVQQREDELEELHEDSDRELCAVQTSAGARTRTWRPHCPTHVFFPRFSPHLPRGWHVLPQVEKKCSEVRKAEDREWKARLIQRTYRGYKTMGALRTSIRDMVTKQRARQAKQKRKQKDAAARLLQVRAMMLGLTLVCFALFLFLFRLGVCSGRDVSIQSCCSLFLVVTVSGLLQATVLGQ